MEADSSHHSLTKSPLFIQNKCLLQVGSFVYLWRHTDDLEYYYLLSSLKVNLAEAYLKDNRTFLLGYILSILPPKSTSGKMSKTIPMYAD